jgi:hypothetical protein
VATLSGGPDLLRVQLDRDARMAPTLRGRLVRWFSTDARAVGRLRCELERCRLQHEHEVGRLRTLLDGGALRRVASDGNPDVDVR